MGNPWRVIGLALGATVLVAVVLNAQFFWLTLRHEFAPAETPAPAPTVAVALEPAMLPADATPSATGITNANLMKIPVGLTTPGTDTDNDGLADVLERLLGTDPKRLDSDGDRVNDFSELLVNRNPLGKGNLPVDVKFARQQTGKYFLQVQSKGELWYVNPSDARRYFVPSASAATQVAAALATAPTPKQLGPNTIGITSLGLEVPVVYVTQATEKAFQEGLKYGVVHYPGTAKPGEFGNAYIFGHSSDYRWSAGKFKTVFAILPDIAVGADIAITDAGGTAYTYRVFDKKVVLPTETKYLQQYDYKRKILTLQTSWPIGTALKRYVVLAELVER